LNVPLKGKGFTAGAGEIFPEVHVSLEQLVPLGLLYGERREERCSYRKQVL